MTPLKRFYNLLELDKKDIVQIFFYAIFAGLVSLSLPLGIQAIINFIQAGRISASWIVLIVLVVIGVALVGILSLMQLRITENLQQKYLFVLPSNSLPDCQKLNFLHFITLIRQNWPIAFLILFLFKKELQSC